MVILGLRYIVIWAWNFPIETFPFLWLKYLICNIFILPTSLKIEFGLTTKHLLCDGVGDVIYFQTLQKIRLEALVVDKLNEMFEEVFIEKKS